MGAISADDPLFGLAAFAALRPGDDPPDILAALTERPEWHEHAACRGQGTADFFPGIGNGADPAKTVCASCPVTGPCLEAALVDPLTEGVWAGTTAKDRRRLRKHRPAA